MITATKTYRFTYDPSSNAWQAPTPRRYRQLGTSKWGYKTYEIRNIPENLTRAQLARKMPAPPESTFYLDYDLAPYWDRMDKPGGIYSSDRQD